MSTPAHYRAQLRALLPRGVALTNDADDRLLRFLLALGDEFARVHARALTVLRELDPRETSELIFEWERLVGLPDECAPLGETLGARRAAVHQKWTTKGNLTPAFVVEAAAQLGFPITIIEIDAFEVGHSEVGMELAEEDAWWSVDVQSPAVAIREPEIGAWTVGEPLGAFGNEALECLLERIFPPHVRFRLLVGGP